MGYGDWDVPRPGWTCAECAFAFDDCDPKSVSESIANVGRRLRAPLTRGLNHEDLLTVVRTRPEPDQWSALEYACHVRDVLEVQRELLHVALDTERPTLEPMGREEHVDLHGYNDEEPTAVADQLVATAVRLADDLAGLDGAGQQRAGVHGWSEEAERTLEWVACHTLHEMKHHLRDIESLLAAARRPFPS